MPRTPSKIVLIGLVAFAMVGVAYPAAYFLLVRKQFTVGTLWTPVWGGGSGGSWTFPTPSSTTTTFSGFSAIGTPSAPSFLFSPHYGAALGLAEGGGADTALSYLFFPLHECDRRFVRVHDWSTASIMGWTKPGPPPWYAVKSQP